MSKSKSRRQQKTRESHKSRCSQKTVAPTARSVAISVVQQVRFGQDAVQAALDGAYVRLKVSERERPLCTELVYGTLRNFDRLEFFLRRFLERFDSLPKEMGIALCVALYELFYTRIPAYATVDTFVALIRQQFGAVLGKVANGVLRNADRSRADFNDKAWYLKECGTPLAALACWYSVPEWLVETWQTTYGPENAQLYLEASSKAAPNTLRFKWQAKIPDSKHFQPLLNSADTRNSRDVHGIQNTQGVLNSQGVAHSQGSQDFQHGHQAHMFEASQKSDVPRDSDASRTSQGSEKSHSNIEKRKTSFVEDEHIAQNAFYTLFPFSREWQAMSGPEHMADGTDESVVHGHATDSAIRQDGAQSVDQSITQPITQSVTGPLVQGAARALWNSFSTLPVRSPVLSFDGPLPGQAYEFMEKGLVSQQSGAILEILSALAPQEWQGPVWDCCCGRGGKTLALLEQGVQVSLASDVSKPRLRGLQEELERLGMAGVCHVERFSATDDIRASQFHSATGIAEFGTVLVDAPCSGFGTLARHPEIRFRRTRHDIAKLAALQGAILHNAYGCLMEGGSLVYITCTLIPDENEEQIARFIKEHERVQVCQTFLTPANSAYGEFFYGARLVKV